MYLLDARLVSRKLLSEYLKAKYSLYAVKLLQKYNVKKFDTLSL